MPGKGMPGGPCMGGRGPGGGIHMGGGWPRRGCGERRTGAVGKAAVVSYCQGSWSTVPIGVCNWCQRTD